VRSFFLLQTPTMGTRKREEPGPPLELAALRRKITELVAQNAVPMVQQAIDAVREGGQYQTIKYLFEMIGLYPSVAEDESGAQDPLAQILLARLGLPDVAQQDKTSEEHQKTTDRNPLQ
jgi:hypothetical protein